MCHVESLCERHFEQLISMFGGFENDMHDELAPVVIEFLELQKLKLHGKGRIFHFESPGDLLARDEFVDHSIRPEQNIPLRIDSLEREPAMLLRIESQYFCRPIFMRHPFFKNARFHMRPE